MTVQKRAMTRWSGKVMMALLAALPLVAIGAAASPAHAADTKSYSEQVTLPVPPASNFPGANGGGDGWAVALTSQAVYNVFHHDGSLQVACHNQVDASACWPGVYKTITDGDGNGFASTAQPGLYMNQATGHLYVFATRTSDSTGGVVCIDTSQPASNADPYCGFTALTPAGDASLPGGISNISNGLVSGNKFYAFNFFTDSGVTGGRNKVLCFDLATLAACPSQPYTVTLGNGNVSVPYFPAPSVATIGTELVIPLNNPAGSGQELACFNTTNNTSCAGTWPIQLGFPFDDEGNGPNDYGAPFPLLDTGGNLTGFCLPTGTEQCYSLTGAAAATPAGLASAVGATLGWNGPGLVIGPRVYVADGNGDDVRCYDFSTSAGCANYPVSLSNAYLLYTVNPDPQRPSCIWVNSDSGSDQIQNLDAFSGSGCGAGPLRVLASSIVPPDPVCVPVSYATLQVISPARGAYTDGTVQFEDSDGFPIAGAATENLDATGTVSLAGLNLNQNGLPQFLITFNGLAGPPGSVTVELTWTGSTDPNCAVGPPTITTVAPNPVSPGSTVTVDGSVLGAGAGTVTLTPTGGGAPVIAPVATWAATTVTATVPAATAAGSYNVTLTTSGGENTNSLPLTVSPPGGGGGGGGAVPPVLFTADTPPASASVGTPYSYTFQATGNPAPQYTVASGSLPPGLSLDPVSGVLSGTPTTPGPSTFTVRASDGVPPDALSGSITITVAGGPPVTTPPTTTPTGNPGPPPPTAPGSSPAPDPGYWLVGADGRVLPFGPAGSFGSAAGVSLAAPVVGVAATPDRGGYWLVGSDGGVFSFGDAGFYGSIGSLRLAHPIVGMAPTPDGRGYWLVGSDGGVFAYGDAGFHGSVGNVRLAHPVVGMASTPDGGGYWLVASDGGVFAFGDAAFQGSTAGVPLLFPIVGMAPTPDGGGYWLVAADGGVFALGDAEFHGSLGSVQLASPIVAMQSSPDGHGYRLIAADGGVFAFGDSAYDGSAFGTPLAAPIIGAA